MKIDKLTKFLFEILGKKSKSFEEICREMKILGDLGGMQGFIYNELINLEIKEKIKYNIDNHLFVLTP